MRAATAACTAGDPWCPSHKWVPCNCMPWITPWITPWEPYELPQIPDYDLKSWPFDGNNTPQRAVKDAVEALLAAGVDRKDIEIIVEPRWKDEPWTIVRVRR